MIRFSTKRVLLRPCIECIPTVYHSHNSYVHGYPSQPNIWSTSSLIPPPLGFMFFLYSTPRNRTGNNRTTQENNHLQYSENTWLPLLGAINHPLSSVTNPRITTDPQGLRWERCHRQNLSTLALGKPMGSPTVHPRAGMQQKLQVFSPYDR